MSDHPYGSETPAGGEGVDLSDESLDARTIAGDREQPLSERLEAFEDIVESEVGDTTMTRARNLERGSGLRQLYLKFEGSNPTGTHKDRIAFAQVADALRRGFDSVVAATCGNYGCSVALACRLAGLECRVYVPKRNHSKRLAEIASSGATIVRVAGDYEAAVALSSAEAERNELYDANPGGANAPLQLKAYGEIAYELYDDLRDAPAAVACPMSNGTLVAGLHRGFLGLYRRGKTSRIPRLVGGSSRGQNPIVAAFRQNLTKCPTLPPETLRETATNEPLINWSSIDGDAALEALRATSGWAGEASDRALASWARQLRELEGLSVLPAATAGMAALIEAHAHTPLPSDRYVAVLTARR